MDRKGPIKSSSVVTDSESTTIYADFRKSVRPDFFAAVNNGFGLSVCELIFTYQVAAFQATLCNSGCRPPSSSYQRLKRAFALCRRRKLTCSQTCVVVSRWTQHAAQIELLACCAALPSVTVRRPTASKPN